MAPHHCELQEVLSPAMSALDPRLLNGPGEGKQGLQGCVNYFFFFFFF